ncbi:MAG TPA: glycosyltransferase [Armatimonadetes bacterium]|nr:glycosyltransferase [Armatimonadota bacterium]
MIRVHFTVKVAVLGALGGAGLLVFWALSKILSIPPGRRGRVRVLGIPVDAITMEEAVGRVFEFVKEGRPHMVVTPDASALVRAQEDEELRRIMEEADLVIPDGVGVVFAGRLLDLPLVERVPGVELAERVCEVASREGLRIFLLGAEPGVAEEAARRLTERFPGLRVVGTYHGYFSPEEEREVVERIKRARPDILFVAMGVPKQEKWMRRHLAELGVPVCIGVGGTLDVFAGRVKRAPLWVRRIGLEWLYRTLLQPRKRARRLLAIPRLLGMVLTFRRIKAKEDKPSQKGVEKG